jgi:hypothetical protein
MKVESINVIIKIAIHEFQGNFFFRPPDMAHTIYISLLALLLLWVAYIVVGMVYKFVITAMRIKRIMNSQGVKGPSFI